ncbi:MAG: hypothetical protein ACRDYC_12250 [Acidimicrobiales bacterium]
MGEIVDEEYDRRGLDPPRGISRELEILRIVDPPTALDDLLLYARVARDLAGFPVRLYSWWRDISTHQPDDGLDEDYEPEYSVAPGADLIEVSIDGTARGVLEEIERGRLQPVRSVAVVFFAELRLAPDDSVEVWDNPPKGRTAHHLGTVPPPDADAFRPALAVAGRVNQRCTCWALAPRDRNGRRRLAVRRPLRAEVPGSP